MKNNKKTYKEEIRNEKQQEHKKMEDKSIKGNTEKMGKIR